MPVEYRVVIGRRVIEKPVLMKRSVPDGGRMVKLVSDSGTTHHIYDWCYRNGGMVVSEDGRIHVINIGESHVIDVRPTCRVEIEGISPKNTYEEWREEQDRLPKISIADVKAALQEEKNSFIRTLFGIMGT